MKKIIRTMAALGAVSLLSGASLAEANGNALLVAAASVNGETVSLTLYGNEDGDANLLVAADSSGAERARFDLGYGLYGCRLFTTDLDKDGQPEIFLWGDEASDDYVTYCLHLTDDGFAALSAPNIDRGDSYEEEPEPTHNWIYGALEACDDGAITVCGSQDVLGTYFGSRVLSLEGDHFEIADDGMWRFTVSMDEDAWTYSALTLKTDLPVTFVSEDGEEAGTLTAGTRFKVSASDKTSIVWFVTREGEAGYFPIEPDTEGWGSLVCGMPEGEVFEFVPYAD